MPTVTKLAGRGDDFFADLRCKSGRHQLRACRVSGEVQINEIRICEGRDAQESSTIKNSYEKTKSSTDFLRSN